MNDNIKLLDAVTLLHDRTDRGLVKGQVGTVVEILDKGVYEVEFSDDEGKTYAMLALNAEELMALHYSPLSPV